MEELLAFPKTSRGLGGGTAVWRDIEGVAERFIRDVLDRRQKQRLAVLRCREDPYQYQEIRGVQPNNPDRYEDPPHLHTDVSVADTADPVPDADQRVPRSDPADQEVPTAARTRTTAACRTNSGKEGRPTGMMNADMTTEGRPPCSSSSVGELFASIPHTRYTHPSRLLALYAPGALVPHLPKYLRDKVSFDEAQRHAAFLQAQLHPQGFMVALTGGFRCGAPQAEGVDMLVALREDRLQQYTASTVEVEADRLWEPHIPHPSMTADHLRAASPFYEKRLRRACERAMEGLHRIGYLVWCQNANHLRWTKQNTTIDGSGCVTVECVARLWSDDAYAFYGTTFREAFERSPTHFADGCPAAAEDEWLQAYLLRPPPVRLTEPAKLLSVRLHTLRLHFTPTALFHIQQFFRTGPPEFTAHLTLEALRRGKRLYADGLFITPPGESLGERTEGTSSSSSSVSVSGSLSSRPTLRSPPSFQTARGLPVPVDSEESLFNQAGMPYIHPVNRAIFMQLQHA